MSKVDFKKQIIFNGKSCIGQTHVKATALKKLRQAPYFDLSFWKKSEGGTGGQKMSLQIFCILNGIFWSSIFEKLS